MKRLSRDQFTTVLDPKLQPAPKPIQCKRTGVAVSGSWDFSGEAVLLQRVIKVLSSRTVWKGRL
jgi:hypothetical protein